MATLLNEKHAIFEHGRDELLSAVNEAIQDYIKTLKLPRDPQFVRANTKKDTGEESQESRIGHPELSEGWIDRMFERVEIREGTETSGKTYGGKLTEGRKQGKPIGRKTKTSEQYPGLPQDMLDFVDECKRSGVRILDSRFL